MVLSQKIIDQSGRVRKLKKRDISKKGISADRKGLNPIIGFLYLPVSVLFMELMSKLVLFGSIFEGTVYYVLLLSSSLAFLMNFIVMLLPGKPRRICSKILLGVLGFWFSFHVTYYSIFHTFFSWQSLGQAKDVTEFWREAINAVIGVWYVILILFVPFILMCVFSRRIIPDSHRRSVPTAAVSLALFAACYLPTLYFIHSTKDSGEYYSPYYYYTYLQNDLDMSYKYYGVLSATRLDVKQLIFGAPDEKLDFSFLDHSKESYSSETVSGSDKEKEYGYNIMDLDFDKASASTDSQTLKTLDEYFKNVPPTRKNEYTGIFKGKNLIFLTLEGFSHKVIDPEFTPLLYKMSTEGFVFKNYYNTVWGGSTASGEYANLTGNIYQNSSCLPTSAETYQPFALGNQFSALGYKTFGYHNNTYTYYDRHLSHPNFGYKWVAIGNGLVLESKNWPNSDREMATATVGDFSNLDVPFHVYYITVSGHCGYSFASNRMAERHRNDLPEKFNSYSSEVRAYLACQYEVELMLQTLVEELDKTGKLQDTVFAMTADHYPYALSDEALAELYGINVTRNRYEFELYRNSFIVWTPSMTKPVTVDAPCSAIDIMPTLSNMFGLTYDSRIILGSDIMSDCEHFALLKVAGWSWISSQGTYKGIYQSFTPSESCTLSEDERKSYVDKMNSIVKLKVSFSKRMLTNDYYRHIFNQ